MASPLQGSIAETINAAFSSIFYDCTVDRTTITGGDAYDPSSGVSSTVSYPCKGMVDTFTKFERQNTLIKARDVKIIILTNSLSITPEVSDKVTIRGTTYSIAKDGIAQDPAQATWTIQGRI